MAYYRNELSSHGNLVGRKSAVGASKCNGSW